MILTKRELLGTKMWVPVEIAPTVQHILLSIPDFGYDFVFAKSKVRKKFHRDTVFVAFFVNAGGGIDHFEVNKDEVQTAYLSYRAEPEQEVDYFDNLANTSLM